MTRSSTPGWECLLLLGACARPAPLESPVALTDGGLVIQELGGANTEAGSRFVSVNVDSRMVIAVPSGTPGLQRWVAVDPGGRVAWTRELDCPNLTVPVMVPSGDIIVCQAGASIHGISAVDGTSKWRWDAPTSLQVTAVAGGRVAASVDNQDLSVLDASTGSLLARYVLDGNPLEAAGGTPDDPLAYIVGGPVKTAAGHSIAHSIVAQPIGVSGPPPEGLIPLSPRWTVPFDGWSFSLATAGKALVSHPLDNLMVSRDAATGAIQWLDAQPLMSVPTQNAILFGGVRDDGSGVVGALDPSTRLLAWQQRWRSGSTPVRAGEGSQSAIFLDEGNWEAFRMSDGFALGEGRAPVGVTLLDASVSLEGTVLLGMANGQLMGWYVPFGVPGSIEPISPLPARPIWAEPGTRLVYRLTLLDGHDPETGYANPSFAGRLEVTIRGLEPDLRYEWHIDDGRQGTRVIPADVMASSRNHSDYHGRDEGERTLAATSLWVSRAVLRDLVEQGSAEFADASAQHTAPIARQGETYLLVGRGDYDAGLAVPVLVPTLVAADAEGRSKYWIAPYGEFPMIMRAERPGFEVYLEAVIPAR